VIDDSFRRLGVYESPSRQRALCGLDPNHLPRWY
jgi:hypothetical protein